MDEGIFKAYQEAVKSERALYRALWQIAHADHPDYPHFKRGTEAEFSSHLIQVAKEAIRETSPR